MSRRVRGARSRIIIIQLPAISWLPCAVSLGCPMAMLVTIPGPVLRPRTKRWMCRTNRSPGHFDVRLRRELLARSPRLPHRAYGLQRRLVGVMADRSRRESHRAIAAAAHGAQLIFALCPAPMHQYLR